MEIINTSSLSDSLLAVEDGDKDPLLVLAEIRQALSLLKEAEGQVLDSALEEAEKYPEKKFEAFGFTFEKRAGRRNYSYKHDDVWSNYDKLRKDREEMLKLALKETIYDKDGVEVVPAVVTTSKDSLIVK